VRQERSDSTKCDKENVRLIQLLGKFKVLYIDIVYTRI